VRGLEITGEGVYSGSGGLREDLEGGA